MILTLISAALAIIITFIISAALVVLNLRQHQDREKYSPFECGFDPLNTSRKPLSLRFFLLAVLFLVFDIEIVFILPIPVIIQSASLIEFFTPILPILLILLLGLFHE